MDSNKDETAQLNGYEFNDDCKSKVLETKEQKSERYRSLYIIYFTSFLESLGQAITMTGIWPYLNKVSDDKFTCMNNLKSYGCHFYRRFVLLIKFKLIFF